MPMDAQQVNNKPRGGVISFGDPSPRAAPPSQPKKPAAAADTGEKKSWIKRKFRKSKD